MMVWCSELHFLSHGVSGWADAETVLVLVKWRGELQKCVSPDFILLYQDKI